MHATYQLTLLDDPSLVRVDLFAKSMYGYQGADLTELTDHEIYYYPTPDKTEDIWAKDGIAIGSTEHAWCDVSLASFDGINADSDLVSWPKFEDLLMAAEGYTTAILCEFARADGLTV